MATDDITNRGERLRALASEAKVRSARKKSGKRKAIITHRLEEFN